MPCLETFSSGTVRLKTSLLSSLYGDTVQIAGAVSSHVDWDSWRWKFGLIVADSATLLIEVKDFAALAVVIHARDCSFAIAGIAHDSRTKDQIIFQPRLARRVATCLDACTILALHVAYAIDGCEGVVWIETIDFLSARANRHASTVGAELFSFAIGCAVASEFWLTFYAC